MEPFNIKININEKETTLTILPEDDVFKIIYYGGIIGALATSENDLAFIAPEDVKPGSLPLYKFKHSYASDGEQELQLTHPILEAIKNEVKLTIN